MRLDKVTFACLLNCLSLFSNDITVALLVT